MNLQIDAVMQTCNAISRQIKDSFKPLTLHYIVHHEGQRTEAFALANHEIAGHPAGKTGSQLLARTKSSEESALIGIAAIRRPLLLGLTSQASLLALAAINIDKHQSLKEVRRHAWRMAWQSIDALKYYEMRDGNGRSRSSEVIIRRRNGLEIASSNLRADVFSVLISALNDDREAIRKAAIERSRNALQALPHTHPEYYPYIIALEATETAYKMLAEKNISKRKIIEPVLRTAEEIGKTFDLATLREWLAFSQPAQDMAWRGYKPEEILSAAINTSEDTYVRAIGYMVSEITEIKPSSILTIRENYSPFADETFNEKLHEKTINRIFEDVIAKGMKLNSARPLLDAANKQNNNLTEGHTVGWCAGALQAAATAFEAAARNNREPVLEARRQFEGECVKTPWETLKQLGTKIVEKYRHGGLVTMAGLQELCGTEPALSYIKKSVNITMSDPSYQNSLQAVRELSARPAMDPGNRPAPKMPQPSRAVQAQMPGLGFGSAGSGAVRTVIADQKNTTEEQEPTTEDGTE